MVGFYNPLLGSNIPDRLMGTYLVKLPVEGQLVLPWAAAFENEKMGSWVVERYNQPFFNR